MSQLSQWQIAINGAFVQGAIQWQDEGVNLGAAGQPTTIDLVGAGITGTLVGNTLTITVPGGGAGIPTIAADTTLAVPGTYATVAAALAFVRSAVRLNDAQVTIAVAAGTTLNEQIVFNAEDMAYVHLQAVGAGVNIDTAGFVAGPLGFASFITVTDGTLGEVTGTWTLNNTVASGFLVGVNAFTRTGELPATPCVIHGAGGNSAITTAVGTHSAFLTSSDGFAVGSYTANYGATINALNGTVTNSAVSLAGSSVNLDGVNITNTAGQGALVATQGSYISASTCTLNVSGADPVIRATFGGTVKVEGGNLNIAAASTGNFAEVTNSNLNCSGINVVGTSTGQRFVMNDAALTQCAPALGVSLAAAYAADNIVPNTITAGNGLILV